MSKVRPRKITSTQQLIEVFESRIADGPAAVALGGAPTFFDKAFLESCVVDLKTLELKARLGERMTPLQRLGVEMLLAAFNLEIVHPSQPTTVR